MSAETVNSTRSRAVIEASRNFARESGKLVGPAIHHMLSIAAAQSGATPKQFRDSYNEQLQHHMNLVMDCFNTGAAMMLKLLHGDSESEPWLAEYDHEERLRELLDKYDLLGESSQVSEPSDATSTQNIKEIE